MRGLPLGAPLILHLSCAVVAVRPIVRPKAVQPAEIRQEVKGGVTREQFYQRLGSPEVEDEAGAWAVYTLPVDHPGSTWTWLWVFPLPVIVPGPIKGSTHYQHVGVWYAPDGTAKRQKIWYSSLCGSEWAGRQEPMSGDDLRARMETRAPTARESSLDTR